MSANTAIVCGRRAFKVPMRMEIMVDFSTDAKFESYEVVWRGAMRAAVAPERPEAAHKYTDTNLAKGNVPGN